MFDHVSKYGLEWFNGCVLWWFDCCRVEGLVCMVGVVMRVR